MFTKYKSQKNLTLYSLFIILSMILSISLSSMVIQKSNTQSNISQGQTNSSLIPPKKDCFQKIDNQSCKFKKFGNFTQILQGTRLGFNISHLNSNENGSNVISEFTP